jgi:hypothetical protein
LARGKSPHISLTKLFISATKSNLELKECVKPETKIMMRIFSHGCGGKENAIDLEDKVNHIILFEARNE